MRYWQVCPLGPTGYGDSPYQCFSAFAGNPYLIDLNPLVRAGLLTAGDLISLQSLPAHAIDYGWLYVTKWPLLFKAHAAFAKRPDSLAHYGSFSEFRTTNASWLQAYCLFRALKDHFNGAAWWTWPESVRFHDVAARSPLAQELKSQCEAHAFFQFLFFAQWSEVRAKAAKHGVQLIGDAPIFVARDSADAWGHPDLFLLDHESGEPTVVAGVPPDYFSADGQLWGNPLYDWPTHQANGYDWWLNRLRANLSVCDVVRIDHFRGFDTYWSIPADAPTAVTGQWENGPGLDFFASVARALPDCRMIAEDLGELAPTVVTLREGTGLPGMTILQFAFGGDADNLYLPHNLRANSVIYPGTHDNDTTLGWYAAADDKTRDHVRRYLRVSGHDIGWDFVRLAYGAVSNLAIIPLQDLLSLDGAARFNTPGKAEGNWRWRYSAAQLATLQTDSAAYLRELGELTGRVRSS